VEVSDQIAFQLAKCWYSRNFPVGEGRDFIVYEPSRTVLELQGPLRESSLTADGASSSLGLLAEEASSRDQFVAVLKFTLFDERNVAFRGTMNMAGSFGLACRSPGCCGK
jgi:hypothetical protein